jgi:mono/diheme cytochrome c family protein
MRLPGWGLITILTGMAFSSYAQTFEKNVLPIFQANCQQCHNTRVKTKDLNLMSIDGALKGSESGPVVMPGKRDDSPLYRMVRDGQMPPGGKNRLSEQDVATIGAWIDSGARSASAETAVSAMKLTQHDVIPVLLTHCSSCHGAQKREAGLDLRTKASILKGGKSGPAFVAGKPEESLIVQKVRSGAMPPKAGLLNAGVKPMGAAEIDKLANWIAQGAPEAPPQPDLAGTAADPLVSAKDRQFWSFRPPAAPVVPIVRHAGRVRNSVDAFILQKLEAKDATLSLEADRTTLIRRATFDLTGLPPESARVRAFLSDKRPDAYERLIDELLASSAYGEKWGRHWLDLAGYADSEGGKLSADLPRANAWRYRDYVIRAFNMDKRYDRFLLEQIAGDELADYEHAPVMTQELLDNLIATGFLRMAGDSTSEREVNFTEDRLDVIADEIEVLTSGVMGLTMKCARCHTHKYDPIPHRDYYRMVALLKGAYDEHDWITPVTTDRYGRYFPGRFLPFVEPGMTPFQALERERQREAKDREVQAEVKALKADLDEKLNPVKKRILEERLAPIPKTLHEDLRTLLVTAPDKRTEAQKLIASRFETTLKIDLEDAKQFDPAFRGQAEALEKRIKLTEAARMPEPKIRALWDRGEPSPTYILRRGSAFSFGPPVEPGVPSVLSDVRKPFEITPPWPGAAKTGRRLALARWLVRPDHPLTARVMVNRIWKHHFGTGIVKSLGNFGKTGTPPSHPELLDWLSVEFVRQGWSMKAMHRLMMNSSTYRQASQSNPALVKLDPENRLLGHMGLRRMEAEELGDAMLQVAGQLDSTPFGPPDPVLVRRDGLVTPLRGEKGWRRSIYVNQRRTELPTLSDNFDLPAMNPACLERSESIVATQALHLLNNAMVDDLAGSFADRVRREAGEDRAKQVEHAYWLALGRPPGNEERTLSLEALAKMEDLSKAEALKKFCHTLMNSAAFIYID